MTVLEEGLVSYLTAYSGLTALISTRVYHSPIPQGATLPCVTYNRIDTPRELTHSTSGIGGDLAHPRFQFDAWATTASAAKAITEQIRAALNGHTGSTGGVTIRAALVEDEREFYEPETSLHRSMSDFVVWHVD